MDLTLVLVEAIQKLEKAIEKLTNQVTLLSSDIEGLKKMIIELTVDFKHYVKYKSEK